MKTTGIVRRIDELGRIVIPKEIRKTLRIRDGENIEISIENDNIILKKFSFLNKIDDYADKFAEAIYAFIKHNIIITDTDNIIAVSGSLKKEIAGNSISDYLSNCIKRRESFLEKYNKEISFSDEITKEGSYCMSTIIAAGDAVGLVIIFSSDDVVDDSDMKICQVAAKFLAKALED